MPPIEKMITQFEVDQIDLSSYYWTYFPEK